FGASGAQAQTPASASKEAERDALPACRKPEARLDQPLLPEPDVPGVINGANHPDQIPHYVAYRLFLRSLVPPTPQELAEHENPALLRAVRESREAELFKSLGLNATEVADFRAVIAEFGEKVRELDRRAAEVKDLSWPDPGPEAIAQLVDLQS